MSAPGRPKGSYRSAKHEGTSLTNDWKPVLAEAQQLALGNDFHCAQHFVLDVKDAGAALRFVAALSEQGAVRFGDARPRRERDETALSIGFTFNALERLGLEEGCLDKLREQARGFAAGANARAAAKLGDTGPSAQERWDGVFAAGRANVLISVHANDTDVLERFADDLRALDPQSVAFDGWDESKLLAEHLGTFDPDAPKVARLAHFGYRDGISRPRIKAMRRDPQQAWHEPGELLLGHENDAGFSLWDRDAWDDATREFFRNATFGVFRQIEQDEPAFARFVAQAAQAARAAGNEHISEDYIKAKLCGRWPTGQLMTEAHDETPPEANDPVTNNFTFGKDNDPHGFGCPFGSHIRRTNPRQDPLAPSRRRPLFRRGIPYGKKFPDNDVERAIAANPLGEGTPLESTIERGLMGLFFCASIEDQFETVMSEWVEKMPMGPPSRGDAKDPLVGQHDEPQSAFDIPRADGKGARLEGFPLFARTRGTLYAFFPGREGLRRIAASRAPAAASSSATASNSKAGSNGAAALAKGAPRRDPPASASGAADRPLTKDEAPADRFCDIVMEGGVTSGIIYASAIAELARHYRFQSIGGSSIGAFAAALAAVAELRRRNGSIDGFNDIADLPRELGKTDDNGDTKLFRLFRPQEQTRRLFEIFCAALGHTSWFARVRHGLVAALRQYRSNVAWNAAIVALLVLGGPLAHLLLAPGATVGWYVALLSWSLALVLSVIVAVTLTLAASIVADLRRMAGGRRYADAKKDEGNGFGLCRGWSTDAKLDDDPDLTGYMHMAIQKVAHRHPVDDAPLTFGDLWGAPGSPQALLGVPVGSELRSINLEVYTTNLDHGRPYRFPIDEEGDCGPLYFRVDDLAPYFPARVLQHLVGHSLPYQVLDPARDPSPEKVPADLRRLPRRELPLVVAVRMAMSFPGLISAVPVWAVSREPPDGPPAMRRCWLSDGGLCSNFPIHLFDSFVPMWPTFGISLQQAPASAQDIAPWLPKYHEDGQADRHDGGTDDHHPPGARVAAFLFALWRAAWQWNDMAMVRVAGVRDRVVRVYLKPGQGGVNIKMTREEIQALAEKQGKGAAKAFIERFAAEGSVGWREHRWVRLNRLLIALRAAMTGVTASTRATRDAPDLAVQARQAAGAPPLRAPNGIAQSPLQNLQVGEVEALLRRLRDFEAGFQDAGDSKPYEAKPRPLLRTRPPV